MPLIIPPGYLQAAYTFSLVGDSEPMVITMGHEIDGASGANPEDAANDLFGAFATHFWQDRGANSYFLEYVVTYAGNDGPTVVNISDQQRVEGSIAQACCPPNTAYLIRKRTDLGGRRGRGRCYIPGVPEIAVDNVGILGNNTISDNQAALDAWHEYLTNGQGARLYPPVILHRSEGAGTEPAPTPIVRFVQEAKVATQRRRLRP